MKAEDLRIGNLITSDGEIFTVDSISKDIVHAGSLGVYPAGRATEDYGIPITEEWLIKFGFEPFPVKHLKPRWSKRHYRKANDVGYHEYHFQLYEKLDESLPMCGAMGIYQKALKNVPAPTNDNLERTIDTHESMYNFAFHIKYIHQLQNLMFALTGEELTV